ncbi:MAG: DUF4179 domain-containing protein, partial [Lachnospiraceae bacterium]|nr:DUF4179 domain-containing protein [Lachnospiraceae bacterium]
MRKSGKSIAVLLIAALAICETGGVSYTALASEEVIGEDIIEEAVLSDKEYGTVQAEEGNSTEEGASAESNDLLTEAYERNEEHLLTGGTLTGNISGDAALSGDIL